MYIMTVEKLENSRVKVTFDVTVEEFESALDKAFETENKKVTIPGFRKGKAPRKVFEKNYGVESLYESALDVVLNAKYAEVYQDENLSKDIIGQPEPILEQKIKRGEEFKISLAFDVYPEFELPQYKGIEVKAKKLTVNNTELDNAVKALAKKDATMQAKAEQVIASGDFATFDFCGSVDGVEFPGGKADNYELQIGSGQFIPGFEDQMIGMKAEESKDIEVTFPESYGEPTLAGKKAVFKVLVHEVKEEVYPEFTDEYVQGLKIEGATDLKSLRSVKRAELKASKETSEKDRQLDDIVNTILDNTKVEMPATLINERLAQIRGQYESQAKMYNIPFETFLQLMNISVEKFNEETETQAKRQALFNLVATKIIEAENLTPSREALEAKADEDAAKNGTTREAELQKNLNRYYSDMAYGALTELLLSNAVEK